MSLASPRYETCAEKAARCEEVRRQLIPLLDRATRCMKEGLNPDIMWPGVLNPRKPSDELDFHPDQIVFKLIGSLCYRQWLELVQDGSNGYTKNTFLYPNRFQGVQQHIVNLLKKVDLPHHARTRLEQASVLLEQAITLSRDVGQRLQVANAA